MVSKRVKTNINKNFMKKKPETLDLADVNARVAIAFALTMILAVLMYIAFVK